MCLTLREVKKEDIDLLYEWVNDLSVRKNSFQQDYISYQEHKKWFNNKMNSLSSYIFIYQKNSIPIGQIRIDINNNVGIIDFSIDNNYRGKGYGTKLLKQVIKKINNKKISIKKVIAEVKYRNKASQRAFEKAGYCSVEEEECIMYYKSI